MFRIKKDAIIVLTAVIILVLGIFSAPNLETSALTGAVTGDDSVCKSFPVDRIQELRDEIEDRMYSLS